MYEIIIMNYFNKLFYKGGIIIKEPFCMLI